MSRSRPRGVRASLQRAAEILRNEGLRSLWFKFLGETGYRRMDLIERKIRPAASAAGVMQDLECRLLAATEVDEFLEFRDYADRDTVLKRLQLGHRCFLVRRKGAIVHCCWTATGLAAVDYLSCEARLAGDVAFVYEAYTAPQHRGRSIASFRSFAMEKYLLEQGVQRLLAVIWPENPPIYRSTEKAGYQVVGRMGYLGAGRFRRHFFRYAGDDPPLQIVDPRGGRTAGYGEGYWDRVGGSLEGKRHYLDPFLAALKRRENLRLVREWGELRSDGRLLKTDVFEEALGEDGYLGNLPGEAGEIIGIDVSPAIVKQAAARNPGHALRFLVADVRCLPFADASFSTVSSPSTLDHFLDPADLGVSLRELFRILEPGGRLVITLDNRQNLFAPLLRLVHWLGMVPYFLGRFYTVDELRGELRDAGFVVQDTTAILHNPRLVAVGAVRLAHWLRWAPLIRAVQKLLLAAQRLEGTRLRYYTGSFVAALAIRPGLHADPGDPP